VKDFTHILRLKNDAEFIWEAEQQAAFEEIEEYLSTPPVLKAPQSGVPFWLYVAAENDVIGAILTQKLKEGSMLLLMWAGGYWMRKWGINLSRNYVFCFIMLVLSWDIIYYLVLA
jgi:hypothetical protein